MEQAERFTGSTANGVLLRVQAGDGAVLSLHLRFDGELLRATGLGRPGAAARAPFYVVRTKGRAARVVAVVESTRGAPRVRGVSVAGEVIVVETPEGTDSHAATPEGWEVDGGRRHGAARRAPPRRGRREAAHRSG